jgi:hypothetical protein
MININQTYGWNGVQSRRLRGGPDIRFGEWYKVDATFNTDRAKRVILTMQYTGEHTGDYNFNTLAPSLTLRMGNHVHLTGKFNYARNRDDLQYVATIQRTAASLSGPLYITGKMEQQTYGLTMNLQVNVTPDISIQWYNAPFTSTARYGDFKKAIHPESRDRDDRFHTFTPDEISYDANQYAINDGSEIYSFKDPDFNFNEFRSNLVVRWEYRSGSTFYFAWQHTMSNREGFYLSDWDNNLERMFALPPTNIFMLKWNYFLVF